MSLSTLPVQGAEIDGGRFALAIRNLRAQGRAAFQQESPFFSADSDFLPSPSSWRAAVLALQRLRFVFLPGEILATLLAVVRALNDTYKAEAPGTGRSQGGMSLDQLLPVVVYVIVAAHSDSDGSLQLLPLGRSGRYGSELTVRCEMLRWFADPRVLNCEGGYYLTVFCSAINVVASQLGQQDATELGPRVSSGERRVAAAGIARPPAAAILPVPAPHRHTAAATYGRREAERGSERQREAERLRG